MTTTPMPDLTRHDALMARSISVIDSFDDIDDMAVIGTVTDDLMEALTEYRDAVAVLAVREQIPVDRLVAALVADTTHAWRLNWVRTTADCDTATAERIIALEPARWAALAGDEFLSNIAAMTLNVADSFADDLEALLTPHTGVVAVPDTIPEGWL